MDLKEYQRLKRHVDEAVKKHDQAIGAQRQLLTELEEEFKVDDILKANKLLQKLINKKQSMIKKFDEKFAKIKEECNEIYQR